MLLTLGASVVVRQGQCRVDGGPAAFEAGGEKVQEGQVGVPDPGNPAGQSLGVARRRGQQAGELTH